MPKKLVFKISQIYFCLLLLLIYSAITPKTAQAQNIPLLKQAFIKKPLQNFQRQKLPKYGAPTGRRGGVGGRNDCPSQLSKIVALVPGFTEEKTNKSTLEKTASTYPTFWIYVPELPSNGRFAEFTLQDIDNNQNIYRKDFLLSGQAGIISFNLPSKPEYSLKIGTKYRWIFTVYCNEEPAISEEYVAVDSYVERVAIPASIKPDDYLAYAQNNIWYDTVTKLAELHRDRPQDKIIYQDWLELLRAINLADISQAKFIENYKFE